METARGNLPFIYIAIVCNPFLPRKVTQPLGSVLKISLKQTRCGNLRSRVLLNAAER